MAKPRLIIVVRHAQSEGNKNRDIHQTVPDHRVKLTSEGRQQALDAGRRLRAMLRADDTLHFFTSPYRRTRETTEGILETLTSDDPEPSPFKRNNIKVYEEPRLREQDFGNFQPCSAEMERMWQERADYGHFFYRIPNGESAADAYDRVSGFNESLWRQFGEDDFGSVCVLVTHGLMSRVFLMKWYHFSVEYFEDLRNINHCEFLIMRKREDSGKFALETKLRTWSELRRERAAALKQKEEEAAREAAAAHGNGSGSGSSLAIKDKDKDKDGAKLERAAMASQSSASMVPLRRWGGCPNGCNHDKSFKIRSGLAELIKHDGTAIYPDSKSKGGSNSGSGSGSGSSITVASAGKTTAASIASNGSSSIINTTKTGGVAVSGASNNINDSSSSSSSSRRPAGLAVRRFQAVGYSDDDDDDGADGDDDRGDDDGDDDDRDDDVDDNTRASSPAPADTPVGSVSTSATISTSASNRLGVAVHGVDGSSYSSSGHDGGNGSGNGNGNGNTSGSGGGLVPPQIDVMRAREEIVSSPDATPSFITPEARQRSMPTPSTATPDRRPYLHVGRDFGGTYSGHTSDADSSEDERVRRRQQHHQHSGGGSSSSEVHEKTGSSATVDFASATALAATAASTVASTSASASAIASASAASTAASAHASATATSLTSASASIFTPAPTTPASTTAAPAKRHKKTMANRLGDAPHCSDCEHAHADDENLGSDEMDMDDDLMSGGGGGGGGGGGAGTPAMEDDETDLDLDLDRDLLEAEKRDRSLRGSVY